MGEVVDHELLLEAAGCEDLGAGLRGEGDGADDMPMLQCMEAFAGVGIPDFAVSKGMSANAEHGRVDRNAHTPKNLRMP